MSALLLTLLSACAPTPDDPAPAAPWFYADFGDGIDADSLALVGTDVAFRTLGGDLGSGPLPDGATMAAALACGEATHLTVALRDGAPDRVWSVPASPCVERRALRADWAPVALGATVAGDTTTAVIVLDVPRAALASVAP